MVLLVATSCNKESMVRNDDKYEKLRYDLTHTSLVSELTMQGNSVNSFNEARKYVGDFYDIIGFDDMHARIRSICTRPAGKVNLRTQIEESEYLTMNSLSSMFTNSNISLESK
jgi:hypothetical protein